MTDNPILYRIIPANPAAHLFRVSCTIQHPDPNGQQLWLPAWIPGSYMIRDFAGNIVSLQAHAQQQPVRINKLDKQTWQCAPCTGALTVEYEVYAYDMSVRSAHLDTTHAFFNGSSVFLAVQGQEDRAVDVEVSLPEDCGEGWRIATTLNRKDTPLFSPGMYTASDYEELIDHPVEMGCFEDVSFDIDGTPHHIIVSGRQHADLARLAKDVQRICRTQVAVFDELPRMERYMFLLQVVGEGYGGLEHRNSCSLVCSRKDLPSRNTTTPDDGYVTLLGLFSHEYFHTWNVKRIRPAEFFPYDLRQENYTRQLWAFEGITSYYDDLGLVRSGVIAETKYLELLGKTMTQVLRGSGRHRQTLHESSFDAWTRFYKQNENAPNAIVSYYAKGAMFALALDLKIRGLTENHHSLDDVMRKLWREYGSQGKGVDETTILGLASEISGKPLDEFFACYLDTTEDLPMAELCSTMGIKLGQRLLESLDDAGGTPPNSKASAPAFNLGARFAADPNGARIQVLHEAGDLQRAGLAANDVIIAVDGIRAGKDNLLALLSVYRPGDAITLHVFRRDELMSFRLTLTQAQANSWYLTIPDTQACADKRRSWLQATASEKSEKTKDAREDLPAA